MVNVIWMALIVCGILVAAFTGQIEKINVAVFEGAKTGVTISFGLISILVFWLGLMKIAEVSGLLALISRWLQPLVTFLFPTLPPDHPARGYILSNLTANLFGLGNAATPMGLKAMEELQRLNPNKEKASPDMITLLAINTSGITLIPTTIIAIRLSFESNHAVDIVGTTLFATCVSTFVAVSLDKWYRYKHSVQDR